VFTVSGVTREGYAASARGTRQPSGDGFAGSVADSSAIRKPSPVALARGGACETVDATVTGPLLRVDLADPVATLVLLGSLFRVGYRIDGDPPRVELHVPDGAIP
jgi:hypothetical protein